jgi:GNAT superfamily N-acetyltransferase
MLEIEQLNREQTLLYQNRLVEILADCVQNGASVGFMLPLDYPELQKYWQGVATDLLDGNLFLLIAKWQGEIAATAQLELATRPNGKHRAEIQKLLVHSHYRNKGIAKALMQKLEAIAAQNHRTTLILDTQTGSLAESLYPKLGWTACGQIPNFAYTPHGKLAGTTFFYKELKNN